MTPAEALSQLAAWTPYLLQGLVWNIVVSLVAMLVGTLLGGLLALARLDGGAFAARAAELATHVTRNVPTFVFLFYLAYLLPFELELAGRIVPFPAWVKASLALAVAVTGFVSDNLRDALSAARRGEPAVAWLFVPSWTIYFVIIIMASSTASVIGVPELVARANIVIGAVGDDSFMLWVYGYAMLVFFLVCMPLTMVMRRVATHLSARPAPVRTPC